MNSHTESENSAPFVKAQNHNYKHPNDQNKFGANPSLKETKCSALQDSQRSIVNTS